MYTRLRQSGTQFGITFGQVTRLPNSRIALEASEYARDHGMYDQFHENMFRAYFTDNRDIGSIEVVLEIAKAVGLDHAGLRRVLNEKYYLSRLEQTRHEAQKYNVSAVPTFLFDGKYKVAGAQPLETFRKVLGEIQQKQK